MGSLESPAAASAFSAAPPWYVRLAAEQVLARFSDLHGGLVEIRLPDGSARTAGDVDSPTSCDAPRAFVVAVRDWKFFWRALALGDIGVGESYVLGEWDCSDLVGLARLLLDNRAPIAEGGIGARVNRLRSRLVALLRANTRAGSRRNIRRHYDLGNELFALFLDESLTYSSAVFEREEMSLAQAQLGKHERICALLDLRPGMEVLDLGCGWGGFALHAARTRGCRVTAVTNSSAQAERARERCREAGAGEVDVRLCDYREVNGSYDRIVSIEMFEAVGHEYYRSFFTRCDSLLRPGGRMFLQTSYFPDAGFEAYRRQLDWIRTYIFPGGLLASLERIAATLAEHARLRVQWKQDIGRHYARTLRCWRERFLAALPEVRRQGFDERFIRMWHYYLATCEAAFAAAHIGTVQMVLERPAA